MTPFETPGDNQEDPVVWRKESLLDQHLHSLLKTFGKVLSAAMAESADVGQSLRTIRDAGYSLYLRVDCQREGASEEQITVAARGLPEPNFQINGDDLTFLRSIGIDPTRKLRRRRPSRPSSQKSGG